MFGMENGGIFEDRKTFWRDIYSTLLTDENHRDSSNFVDSGSCKLDFPLFRFDKSTNICPYRK